MQDINLLSQRDPEVMKVTAASSTIKTEATLEHRMMSFSDWHCSRKATALCMLYINRLRERAKKSQKRTKEKIELKADDIQKAESVIIKSVQAVHFQKEIKFLKTFSRNGSVETREAAKEKKACRKSSSLRKLDPFLDPQGILQAGGRL